LTASKFLAKIALIKPAMENKKEVSTTRAVQY
jgi:hypothetical protein